MSVAALADAIDAHGVLVADGVTDADEFAEIAARLAGAEGEAAARRESARALADIATTLTRAHQVRPTGARAGLDARLRATARGDIGFSRLSYGTSVAIRPGSADPADFLFPFSLRGMGTVSYGAEQVVFGPRRATVIAPYREFRSDLDARFDQVLVTVPRSRVESVAASLGPDGDRAQVDLALDAFEPPEAIVTMLTAVVQLTAVPALLEARELQLRQQSLTIEALLLSAPGFRRALIAVPPGPPRSVRTAVSFMIEHLGEPLPIGHVAEVAGVTARALQAAFRREFDRTPTQWLREARLDRAHDLISAGAPQHPTITEIAAACGMFHAGEFSARFRERYGRTPSSMLRDARRGR